MKKILFYGLLLVVVQNFAQTKLVTKTGKITFEASVPAFEEVKAKIKANHSKYWLGKKRPETGKLISQKLTGKKHTPKHNINIGLAGIGRKWTSQGRRIGYR